MSAIATRPGRRAALLAILVLIGGAALAVAHAGAAAKLAPPVIHEKFTLLPCPKDPQATLDLEGCAEHQIVATDKQIDAVAKKVFGLLNDDAARKRFVTAQKSWHTYRDLDCVSQSDKYEGGTLAGLVGVECTADRTKQHLKEIKAFQKLLANP